MVLKGRVRLTSVRHADQRMLAREATRGPPVPEAEMFVRMCAHGYAQAQVATFPPNLAGQPRRTLTEVVSEHLSTSAM